MTKKDIVNLIKCYVNKDDDGFKNQAIEIEQDFNRNGDIEIAEYIAALLNNTDTFEPQMDNEDLSFFTRIEYKHAPLPLPESIRNDVYGIINAISRNIGVSKFLFEGKPGTGKTETAKTIAKILNRDLYSVNFDALIDFKLGETSKRISKMFNQMNALRNPNKVVFLFDEIDAIAINRIDNNDLREMGRATSALIKGLDNVNPNIVIIATTNLYKDFDKAIIRRFDSVVDFDRYTREDLINISEIMVNDYLNENKGFSKNTKLFKKIISLMDPIPSPGELKNIIKTSIAFSDVNNDTDYLRRLFQTVTNNKEISFDEYQKMGFTLRDTEILTKVSKSQISRELRGK